MYMTKDKIGALVILVFSLGYGAMAWQLPSSDGLSAGGFTPRTFPLLLSVAGVVLSLVLMAWRVDKLPAEPDSVPREMPHRGLNWQPAAALCAMMCVYAALFPYLGFGLSTVVFLIGAMLALGIRHIVTLVLGSVPVALLFWLVLNKGLGVYLAPGSLFQ